jgi:uncharacterized phage-like protein YoqJ
VKSKLEQKTKQISEITEMKILRKIIKELLKDKVKSTVLRGGCEIETVKKWINKRITKRYDHIFRMGWWRAG